MNPWILRVAAVALALALAPLVINGTSWLITSGVNSVTHGVKSFFDSIFTLGDEMRMEALIKLAVGIVVLMLIARGISRIRGG